MADQRNGGIPWTDCTWNPTRGCSPVSPGCANCYAARMANRLSAEGMPYEHQDLVTETGKWSGIVTFDTKRLALPLRWRKPRRIFVNSMSDLFHHGFSKEQIAAVFGVMAATPQHTYQVLTKRPQRALEWFWWLKKCSEDLNRADDFVVQQIAYDLIGDEFPLELDTFRVFHWPLTNVHLLVSCEDQQRANERIPILLRCPAAIRGVSLEPLLGPIDLTHLDVDAAGDREWCQIDALSGRHTDMGRPCDDVPRIAWVIVGGESGPNARPMHPDWVRSLRDQCRAARVPFFFKQWGTWFPYVDEDKYTCDRAETAATAQLWLRDDGESGVCWIYDDDGTWQNHTGDPGNDMDRVVVMNRGSKRVLGARLNGKEYRMFPGERWP